jgi:hypothetical protein
MPQIRGGVINDSIDDNILIQATNVADQLKSFLLVADNESASLWRLVTRMLVLGLPLMTPTPVVKT